MTVRSVEGRVALQLVVTMIGVLHLKGQIDRKTVLLIFDAAAMHFDPGSPEKEALDQAYLGFAETLPPDPSHP